MLIALIGSLVGCGPTVLLDDGGMQASGDSTSTSNSTSNSTSTSTGTSTTPPGTTVPPPGTTTSPPPDTTSGPDGGFIFDGLDDPGSSLECDVLAQDCPAGEKCMPWANDGGDVWNATRCSPVAADPDGPGEPCTVEGSPTSGIDTCDHGAMCWDVDPATNEGTCVQFCTGNLAEPMCREGSLCSITNDDLLILCLPTCDPLLQTCPDGQVCVPSWSSGFICTPTVPEPAGPGEPCESIDACEPGLACVGAELVPDCMATGCCTALCDITDPMPPCLPGQACTAWFEPGAAPPDLENVGACALPT